MLGIREDVIWPIIYVRGYAMTQAEIDQTTADPFCGFNLGSTVYRATADKNGPARKFVFESPVVRLGRDFGYASVYDNGLDIVDKDWGGKSIRRASVIIFRYYEEASGLLGSGKTPTITHFAAELSDLIQKVSVLVCKDEANHVKAPEDFRCYLVAHSMGGLVCRTFLADAKPEIRSLVGKVFTYATPHNGIELAGANVPQWLTANDLANFNRENMAKYLNLETHFKKTERVDWLPTTTFPSHRFFCMIGTNRNDYEAARGLSRAFAGHGSDGLVRIENASVWGIDNSGNRVPKPCATAYAYRAHSGYFGIVNSEEAYQNLTRFLFGDVRVDMWVDVGSVQLPAEIAKARDDNKPIQALYQFEVLASPRGKRWYLTRRVAEEDSVACRTLEELTSANPADKEIYLSTVFLANYGKVDHQDDSLSYAVTIGVRVPDYEIDGAFWNRKHYEGGYLFRDTVIIVLDPAADSKGKWRVQLTWQATEQTQVVFLDGTLLSAGKEDEMTIPFGDSARRPSISGHLRFTVRGWNVGKE